MYVPLYGGGEAPLLIFGENGYSITIDDSLKV